MKINFKIGQEYFYILWGEVTKGKLVEIHLYQDRQEYCFEFSPYVITEDRIFVSREEAEDYLIVNEKYFLQQQIKQIEGEIQNCDLNIDAYQKKKTTRQKELKKLQKKA